MRQIFVRTGVEFFICGAYRWHISIPVLEKLRVSYIIGYALQSDTIEIIQPLDLDVLLSFRSAFISIFQTAARGLGVKRTFDEFDVCRVRTTAYEQPFSFSTVISGSHAAGLSCLEKYKLSSQKRRYSSIEPMRMVFVQERVAMLETHHRDMVGKVLGEAPITKLGFLDTGVGWFPNVWGCCEASVITRSETKGGTGQKARYIASKFEKRGNCTIFLARNW